MIPVSPQDLHKHWAFVSAGLQEIIRITREDWTPTHVRQGINEGWAFLYVEDDGFIVLQRLKEEWTAEPYLHIWAMWFEPNKAKEKRSELASWLKETTERAGCRRWKFGSPRMGWGGVGECEVERVIYRSKE